MLRHLRASYFFLKMMKRASWSRSRLANYQNKSLRRVIHYAYNCVPFYRRRFRELGLKASDIRSSDDLGKLPVIRKSEIRDNLDSIVSKHFEKRSLRTIWTSGSTGRPMPVVVTRVEDDLRKVKHIRANAICGHKPFDKWAAMTSPTNFGGVTRFQHTLGVYAPAFVSIFDSVDRQVRSIQEYQPDVLEGYSSSLRIIGREIRKRGIDNIQPRLLFGGAEMVDSMARENIERAFGVPLYDQYASIEFARMAWQCPRKEGFHIDADTLVMEFLDRNAEPVSPNEQGEIVCTSLTSFAMPFIRYSIGDYGVLADANCECGMSFPMMKCIQGRSDSLLYLPNGNTISPVSMIIAIRTSGIEKFIDQYRVTQKKLNLFDIQIQLKDNRIQSRTVEERLISQMRKMFGVSEREVTFEINFVKDIPLERTGKARAIVAELPRNSDRE